jgi:signal transduction histidine kinase
MREELASRVRTVALLGLAFAQTASPPPGLAQPASESPWRVLLLHGSDNYVPSNVVLVDSLRSALAEAAAPRLVAFQAEVLDTVSFGTAHHEPELLALLVKKHRELRFDLLMPVGEGALRFVERHRATLWPGTPVVFLSVSQDVLREHPAGAGSTGVTIDFDEAGTLALARRLQPDATRVLLLAGASEYDRYWWPRLEAAASREGQGLEVEALFGQPLGAALERVAHLPRHSIVLYTSISRDGDGQAFVPAVVAEQLSRSSPAPVYSTFEGQVGRGVVGGSMESFDAHGRRAAALALRVLRGERPEVLPVALPSDPAPVVDWRQLQRFGLSEAALPSGSIVRFRERSPLEEYRGYVATAALALAVQAGLIVALLAQSRRRQRAEAQAARQRAELAHAARLSAVGELTASVAHEINQPLGAILSNAEAAELFLDADPPRLDRVRQILRDIRQEDRRASQVIQEVRALARKQSPESSPLSLNDAIGDVMALVEADARRRGVAVETDLAASLPDVSGDCIQIQQVLLNLALNGLEALGPPAAGERRLRIETRANGSGVELVVSDTGPGLAPEDVPRVFESFFTTKEVGLGLGLSIVRSIVEAHEGRVLAENNAGGGATFRVLLPARRGHPGGRLAG